MMKEFWQRVSYRVKNYFIPNICNNYRPCILVGRFWVYILVALVVLKLVIIGFFFGFKFSPYFFADISKVSLIELTNQQRKATGLPALLESAQLDRAAQMKAQDMLAKSYFSHQSPAGVSPWFWVQKSGYNYKAAGENLGIGFLDSQEVHQAWLDSPTHFANIVNPAYQDVGIAVIQGNFQGADVNIVVQLFGAPGKTPTVRVVQAPAKTAQSTPTPNKPANQPAGSHVLSAATTAEPEITTTSLPADASPASNALRSDAGWPQAMQAGQPATATPKALLAGKQAVVTSTLPLVTTSPLETELGTKQAAPFRFAILKFFSQNFYGLAQNITWLTLAFLIVVGLINILVAIRIQHKDLLIKTGVLLLLLIALLSLDQSSLLSLIPHNLRIS